MSLELRPYQTAALERVSTAFAGGLNRLLVKSPTGTGKTVMFARIPTWPALASFVGPFGQGGGARMLVIAHREELLLQAQAKIAAANPGAAVSIEQADKHASRYSDVIVASIQTLVSGGTYARLARLLARHTFRVVIVDEAHHAAAASYRTVLARLGFLPMADASTSTETEAATFEDVDQMTAALTGWDKQAPKDRLLIGVTATPNRSDAIGLGCVFQTIASSYALKDAIEDGWLVPIKPWVIETSESLDGVGVSRGDFKQGELANAVNNPRRNRLAVAAWKLYAPGVPTIAFAVDVQHAIDMAETFRAAGVRAFAISGVTDKEERRRILAEFQKGNVDVITNCMVLTEGTDLPIAGCILHGKPTKSATLYEQMTGRGLRLYPGKTECVVIDLVDVARRHSLQAAPVLYGLPPGVTTKGQDLRKLAEEIDALREKIPNLDELLEHEHYTIEQLRDRASTFNVWEVPSLGDLGAIVSMNWIKLAEDTFRVSYPWGDGTEILTVSPDVLGKFSVALTLRPSTQGVRLNGGQPVPVASTRQRTLAADIPTIPDALKCAEAFVEQDRRSVLKLKDKTAPWRARPASPKQVAYLERIRVPFDRKTVTMGQASDMIDLHNVRKGR